MKTETLKFLREYFRIPASKKIGWAIIEEISENGATEYKPGIYIENSHVYLDIAKRRFFSIISNRIISRRVYPAFRTAEKLSYRYTAKENRKLSITRSKTYISDVYYSAIYSKELENEILLWRFFILGWFFIVSYVS